MTKEVTMNTSEVERKLSVPKICHNGDEIEDNNVADNKLLQRRKMINTDIPNFSNLTVNPNAHGRSCSFRNRPRPKLLNVDSDRPRRSSLPSPHANYLSVSFEDINRHKEQDKQPLQRVRSFKTTTKGGIVNRGDSFKRSSNSVNSTGSAVFANEIPTNTDTGGSRQRINSNHSKDSGNADSSTSSVQTPVYKVSMLGDKGVGKTALTNQFMTSEFVAFENDSGKSLSGLDNIRPKIFESMILK